MRSDGGAPQVPRLPARHGAPPEEIVAAVVHFCGVRCSFVPEFSSPSGASHCLCRRTGAFRGCVGFLEATFGHILGGLYSLMSKMALNEDHRGSNSEWRKTRALASSDEEQRLVPIIFFLLLQMESWTTRASNSYISGREFDRLGKTLQA